MNIIIFIFILKIILWVVIVGGLVFLFFSVCSIYTNLTTGVPWVKIPKKNLEIIFKEINLPRNSLLIDLGCGDGRVLFTAEKFGLRAIGYELSLYPFLKALMKKIFSGSQAVVIRKDFFKMDLSLSDAVFIFLAGETINKVGRKLKHELKSGALVISYGFKIAGWPIIKIIATKPSLTYVYKP